MGFKKTPLWQTSFAPREGDSHGEERERLRASYEAIRRLMVPLLNEVASETSEFTLHDETHSDALWETCLLVYGQIEGLNPLEVWLLAVVFLFHDAAMGPMPPNEDVRERLERDEWRDLMANTFLELEGRWPDDAEIDEPPAKVYDSCVERALRTTHAFMGTDLALKAWRFGSDERFIIEDAELRECYGHLIGKLVASHWTDVGDLPDLFGIRRSQGALPALPEEWKVDPLKLACILRLADATQIDSRRAPSFLFGLRNPQGVSREHWVFQKDMVRPLREGDRIVYSSLRPFAIDEATAWWRALGYLQEVDRELRRVDHLLCDLGRPRMAARAVAGVDKPERFATYFEVEGWQPIDAKVDISDVRSLVAALGGDQLYGPNRPEVALRELVQNAQDAILARRVMDTEYPGGKVVVRLAEGDEGWSLEVRDDGVGMDVDILKDGLLDFGRSGWRTDAAQRAFPGLLSGGFRPTGEFGVGFYAVLMLGDQVVVTTRRFDLGTADARRLSFDEGLKSNRPMVRPLPERSLAPLGTVVRVVLRQDPFEAGGLLATTSSDRLVELVRRLVPGHAVPITVVEQRSSGERCDELAPFDLATASPGDVFDQLYPPREGYTDNEGHRRAARAEFCAQATEIVGDDGERLGLAVLGGQVSSRYHEAKGVAVLHGFRADRCDDFTGYIEGQPRRASRDQVELACTSEQLGEWVASQVRRRRERGLFDTSAQLELAGLAFQAAGHLPDDHCVALTADGQLRVGDIAAWAADHDEILVSYGGPCEWETRPPGLWYRPDGRAVVPPPGWVVLGPTPPFPTFEGLLPRRSDPAYAEHRHDPEATWQKRWWRTSGDREGIVLRRIARAWGCGLGDLLGPPADRGWKDAAEMIDGVTRSLVLRLERPRPPRRGGTRRKPPSPTAR